MHENIILISSALMINFIAVMSPGPDFALILRSSLIHNRRAGILTAMGMGTGVLFHTSYAVFLLPHLLSYSNKIIEIVRYGGSLYLFYLSIQSIRAGLHPHHTELNRLKNDELSLAPARVFFTQGLLCNVLNPKAALFFISIFTIILVRVDSISLKIICALGMAVTVFCWFSAMTILLTQPGLKKRIQSIDNFSRYIYWLAATVFIVFATLLLFINI
jgi:threonine/homoserine/homoserine lactone efflux protein